MKRSDFIGDYDDETIDSTIKELARHLASPAQHMRTPQFRSEHELEGTVNEIILLGMELAFHHGFDVIAALEGGLSWFGTTYLGTEEAPFRIVVLAPPTY